MNPYQQLVDELNLMVNDDRLLEEKQVETLCAQYRKAVNEINRRLIDCDSLFQRGYKTEVVQEAERSPNLLDTVALLDFPDLDLLKTLVSTFQLDPLPSLRHDIAATVNECYSGNQVADRILRQFRLYSLGLAPLETRLALLRKLHTLDDSNLGWAEDLIAFERARISQIQKEARDATDKQDIKKLQTLYNELRSAEWAEKPPTTIASSIKSNIAQFNHIELSRKAADFLKKFEAAHFERDEERCRHMAPELEQYRKEGSSCFSHEQERTVEVILEWLDAEDRIRREENKYQNLVEQLDRELADDRVKFSNAEKTYQAILKLGRPVPDRLISRFIAKKAENDTITRMKSRIIAAAALILLTAISSSAALIYRTRARDRRVADYDVKLNSMISEMRLDEAEQLLEKIQFEDPALVNRPQLTKRERELTTSRDQERKRLNSYKVIQDQIKNQLKSEANTFEGLSKMEAAIKDGQNLARLPDEKVEMERFQSEVLQARSILQKQEDDAFMVKFGSIRDRVEGGGSISLQEMRQLLTDLVDLKKDSPRVRMERVALIDPLTTLLNTSIREREKMESEQRDLERLSNNFQDTKSFTEALKGYLNIHPSDTNAQQLKTMMETEAPVWHHLDELAILQREINAIQKSKLTSAEASRLYDRWNRLKDKLEFHQAYIKEPHAIDYLKSYAKRDASGEPSLTSRIIGESILGHPLIQKAKYLCDLDGRAYYLSGDPSLNDAGNVYSFRRFTNPEMNREVITAVRANEIDLNKSTPPGWANGIKSMSDSSMTNFQKAKGDYWDDILGRLILDIQVDKRADDLLKYRIMNLLIKAASEGSPLLKEIFLEHQGILSQSNVDMEMNWANPDSTESADARSKLRPVLERLPDAAATKKKLKQRIDNQPRLSSGVIFECVGVIHKKDMNNWDVLRSNRRIEIDGPLYVVKTGGNPEFKEVGAKRGARYEFNVKDDAELSEFRAVWIVTDPGSKSK